MGSRVTPCVLSASGAGVQVEVCMSGTPWQDGTMRRSRGPIGSAMRLALQVGLALWLWLVCADGVRASDGDCPRPTSATCSQRYVFGIEAEIYAPLEFPDIRFGVYNSTYAYNVESQGTFVPRRANCQGPFCDQGIEEVNGFTLFGDFVALQVLYSPVRNVRLYGGVFFAVPFGGEQTIDDIRPLLSFVYSPLPGMHLIAGTLQPRHRFFDAIFDDLLYFIRPVEQGFQVLVDTQHYDQDLFINWQQENTRIKNERFDVGYVGKLKFGPARLNGQFHWDHSGGEIPFPDFRPLQARNNFAWAAGPELAFSPSTYRPSLWWWRLVGVAFTFMGDKDEPNSRTPALTTRGHAYELRGWIDIRGWRIEAARWKSDNFVTTDGDRFYGVRKMTEVALSTLTPIVRDVSLEFGAVLRFIDGKENKTPANVTYAAVHWDMDFDLGPLFQRMR